MVRRFPLKSHAMGMDVAPQQVRGNTPGWVVPFHGRRPGKTETADGDFVMEVKADPVHTDVAEAWVKRQQESQPTPPVRPVKETEAAVFRKEDKEEKQGHKHGSLAELDPNVLKEVAEKTQAFLDDLNIRLDFEVYEETGEMVIRIFNRETEELVRQIPPEQLLRLHHKIAELRGVLFDEKA
jgi:flagellar protein FlaG